MMHRIRVLCAALAGLPLLASGVSADVLHLKRGGRLEGIVVLETPSAVTLDMGLGRVSVPRSSVNRIERKESALSEYRSRLASVLPGDIAAHADLARFAGDRGLKSEARLLWARVASLDPGSVEAHLALGHVLVAGTYMDEDEAYRARGYISFDGRWMTPAEQAFLLREREARALDERRMGEARRAAREADDRARRAEAVAERARASSADSRGYGGWGYGASVLVGSPHFGGYSARCRGVSCSNVPPVWTPRPAAPAPTPLPRAVPVRPSSIR
jgi:hypothetical protein